MAQLWQQNSEDDAERLCLIDFVHPDSPVLKSVIITAKDRMAKITEERWGKAVAELPAYLPPSEWVNDPSRTVNEWVSWEVEALYETLRELRIAYAVERWDSTVVAQMIRTPEELLSPSALGGPCLDLVLLMASCLARVGLHPLVIIIHNPPHAILGYWLNERPFEEKTPADEACPLFQSQAKFEQYRRVLESKDTDFDTRIGLVECTGLSQGENLPFSTAREVGEKRWWNEPICFCLDVKTAWLAAPGWEIQSYLRAVREQLGRLPQMWYPTDTDLSQVRMRVRVRQGRRQYDEAKERERELRWRQGVVEAEKQSPYKWRGSPDEREISEEAAHPLDWDREVRMRLQRGVILGDPGFGKTWLLKYEGWRLAKEGLKELEALPLATDQIVLPIYVRLAVLARIPGKLDDALIQLLRDSYGLTSELQGWIRERLNTDRCLLLLDGLDEVPVEENSREPRVGCRNELYARLKHFADTHQCRIWLTSRIVGYQGPPFHLTGNERQGELEILPFDRRQQEAFAYAWFASQSEVADRFLRELRSAPHIRGLGQVPLLLAMLCKTYGSNQHQLPARRVELYESCLNGLLQGEWKDPKPQLSEPYLDAKRELAEELAYQLFDQGKELFYLRDLRNVISDILKKKRDLREDLGNKSAVKLIDELSEQDGLLIKAGAGENLPYIFLHLTFQEYLTACALARRHYLDAAARIIEKPFVWEPIVGFAAELIPDATELVSRLTKAKSSVSLTLAAKIAGNCQSCDDLVLREGFINASCCRTMSVVRKGGGNAC